MLKTHLCFVTFLISAIAVLSPADCSKLDDFSQTYYSAEGKFRKLVKNVDGTYSFQQENGQNKFTMGVVKNVHNAISHAKRVYIERDNVLLQVLWRDKEDLPDILQYVFSEKQLKRTLYSLGEKGTTIYTTTPTGKDCSRLDDCQKEYSKDGAIIKLIKNDDGSYTLQVKDGQMTFTMGEVKDVHSQTSDTHGKMVFIKRKNVLLQVLWKDNNELPDLMKYEFSDEELKMATYDLNVKDTDTLTTTNPEGDSKTG